MQEIVLTGGSAAGKSTAASWLAGRLRRRGWKVLVCPEAPTVILGAGARHLAGPENGHLLEALQGAMLDLHLELRGSMRRLAAGLDEPALIIYDRGEMDGLAYAGAGIFERLLQARGLQQGELRTRYPHVIHLQSVAGEHPELHSRDGNPARWDDAEHAAATDRTIAASWHGAEHVWTVPAYPQVEHKLEHLWQVAGHALGLEGDVEHERKWLLAGPPDRARLQALGAVPVQITQTYLQAPEGQEARVRRRELFGHARLTHTVKEPGPDGGRLETERHIDQADYERLLGRADPARGPVVKTRWCWTENGQYFELDELALPEGPVWLLEAETAGPRTVTAPDWLAEPVDVTGQAKWSNGALALRLANPAC